LIQIAVTQIPSDKLAAYNKGRRDQLKSTESIIEALRLAGVIDISTGHMILNELNTLDQRPKVEM
jgi:hypothetical protein